ncbi:GNAT family N-acetyltransferase [Cellulomonas hominis]|uniref:GNAT family N-acetyltransferase n=1 Tax=Cellulomonas hominis TaxID=156981 RepID=A0A7Z8JXN3_9CELL|nr:GNAT family N-acetyltransferase [Cellulomonas hominis]
MSTDRLLLRPATPDDAGAVWRYRRLPEVARWMTALPRDEQAFAAQFVEPDRLGPTLVVEREGAVVGDLMVRIEDGWGQTEVADRAKRTQAEIGWAFDPAAQGRGLATEAVRRLLDVCFTDLGLRRLTALCFADNAPSWRLMERVGMRREGEYRADSLHRDGRWLDSYAYALLREEWQPAAPGR